MTSYILEQLATDENFDELAYLSENPDVARAVRDGYIASGKRHFELYGKQEKRKIRNSHSIKAAKRRKMNRLRSVLQTDLPHQEKEDYFDFLSDDLKSEWNIVETEAVSSHGYGKHVMHLVEKYADGLVLDCGAGRRPIYYENVVNFDIVAYDTTDVVGVGEELPFNDHTFDAILSNAVLEHVKDPFCCAREIIRVLKPGGELYCCAPFLVPLHGYPHHYYNMSHQGLKNLFDHTLIIDNVEVIDTVLPIWSLTWILNSWANGLSEITREKFLNLQIRDLLGEPGSYLDRDFVRELSPEKNFELAAGCVLFAHKPLQAARKAENQNLA